MIKQLKDIQNYFSKSEDYLREAKWDRRFLQLAEVVSSWSKDPSTQVGAVIADWNELVAVGYNGLPPGLEDTYERLHNRETKYSLVKHAEENALFFASRTNYNLSDCTMYMFSSMGGAYPCHSCATDIIRAGIRRFVTYDLPVPDRWKASLKLSQEVLEEVGTTFVYYSK